MSEQLTREQMVELFDKQYAKRTLEEAINKFKEEVGELLEEFECKRLAEHHDLSKEQQFNSTDHAHMMKEMCDVQYTLGDLINKMGYTKFFPEAFQIVHEDNMEKGTPDYRKGKVEERLAISFAWSNRMKPSTETNKRIAIHEKNLSNRVNA